jgi:hypothetical protein
MYTRWRTDDSNFYLTWPHYVRGTLPGLFSNPAAHLYLVLALVTGVYAGLYGHAAWQLPVVVGATILAQPLAWHLIHRSVLHGCWLYRSPITAGPGKHVHFDHHQDPHRMDVLFGSPFNTVPRIVILLLPLGWLIAGGATAALCTGFVITCIYESTHCVPHLNFKPRNPLLRRMKELLLIHRYHDETGSFGITSFAVDRMLGTYVPAAQKRPRSPHVFNVGYDAQEARSFLWVARLSGHMPRKRPRRAGETNRP